MREADARGEQLGLTDDEVASILDYAERYVGYRLDYMDDPPAQAAAPAGEAAGEVGG